MIVLHTTILRIGGKLLIIFYNIITSLIPFRWFFTESSAGRRVEKDINAASNQSLDYLYDRAKYWKDQPQVEQKSPKPERTATRNASHKKRPSPQNDNN